MLQANLTLLSRAVRPAEQYRAAGVGRAEVAADGAGHGELQRAGRRRRGTRRNIGSISAIRRPACSRRRRSGEIDYDDNYTAEIGGDWEHRFSPELSVKGIALATFTSVDQDDVFRIFTPTGTAGRAGCQHADDQPDDGSGRARGARLYDVAAGGRRTRSTSASRARSTSATRRSTSSTTRAAGPVPQSCRCRIRGWKKRASSRSSRMCGRCRRS